MIDEIHLDSDMHVERRSKRREIAKKLHTLIVIAEAAKEEGSATADAQLKTLKELQDRLGGEPWDAPDRCLCHDARRRTTTEKS